MKTQPSKPNQTKPNQTKPAALLELLICQAISLTELLQPVTDRHVRKALTLIHAEPERKWSYKDFARDFNCSPDHFRHVFVAEVGLGLPHYLSEMRLFQAVQLLNTTELTLQQIAAQIGMSSELALRRAFKTKFGICPSDYRNNAAESVAS